MKKRLLSLIMAVMMVVVLVVPAAAATTDTTSGGSSLSVTDFSFYAARSWRGTNSVQEHSEYPIQLMLVDGEYVLYAPFTGLSRLGKNWDLRVEAPESYTDTFSLYYLTYRDPSGKGTTSNVAYSVNAASTQKMTEEGKAVQSVQTDYMSFKLPADAEGSNFLWSETMTLTWTENGEQKTCDIHVRPYCDLESPTEFHIMNLTDKKNCALEQVDETTYKTQVVVGKETIVQLQSLDNRIAVRFNDIDRTGEALSLDTTEVGTKTYTIELSDKKGEVETRTYRLIVDTIILEYDYTPKLDVNKSTNKGKVTPPYQITTAEKATLKMVLDETQAQEIQEAGGHTSYSWTLNGTEVSTTDTFVFDTTYKTGTLRVSCTITNTVYGMEWSKGFGIMVVNKMPNTIDYIPTVKVTNTGASEYTVGYRAGQLTAEVIRDVNMPGESMLRYQWYSKGENETNWTAIDSATAKVYYPLTNVEGATTYCCVARMAYSAAKVPTTVPEEACVTITVKAREWAPETGITGSGTADDPYILRNAASFAAVRDEVNAGISFNGVYFKMAANVTLPADWEPMGGFRDSSIIGTTYDKADMGRNLYPFSGTLDGNGHTLTISKPLLNFAREAVVKNLNIQGERIEGNGLLQYYTVDYGDDGIYATGVPDTITIENCHIIGKTNITQSGFLGGYASGANTVVISSCSVGKDVVIGCDKDQDRIGSLAGDFNGTVVNCTSAATVYGVNRVGGLVGAKGQSMGLCEVMSSSFTGKVIATGNYVGGIMGSGYVADSAPNSPWARIIGCFVSGSVEGKDYVGGITGGEPGVLQCWGNGAGVICDNVF